MEQAVMEAAMKQYLKHKEAMKRYYEKNKEKMIKQITEARRNRKTTRLKEYGPKPKGRPRGINKGRKYMTEEEFLKLGVEEQA